MLKQKQYSFLEQVFKPLTLCFDHNATLTSWHGDLAHYGFNDDIDGLEATELLPLLVGLETQNNTELPYVNLLNGSCADIHIVPNDADAGFVIYLLDSSQKRAGHEQVQQVANEVSLLNARLEVLTTELELKNTELDKANQAKSEFIAGMSHEFRTPIVSILGHCQWLAKQIPENAEWLNNLQTIERSTKFLLALIDNLLQQGKISARQMRITKSPVNISAFINRVTEIISPLARGKGITLASSLTPGECNCYLIDQHHLQQVLINILSNAVKFTGEGAVSLSVECRNKQLIIEVTDTGIGIPENDLEEILIPFTRAKNATAFQGAGLGLSIANEIITLMMGEMEISSEVNKGTRVLITLPVEDVDCASPESDSSAKPAAAGPVLLMEDNLDIVSIYQLFFKDAGIDLTAITEPEAFSQSVQKVRPALILIDYHLGRTTGIELVKDIRHSGYSNKIIMLTATSDINDQLRQEALAAGCDRFMEKPADVKSLVDLVKSEISSIRAKQ